MEPSTETADKLLGDYDNFVNVLLGEITNLCEKLAKNEPQGWEGTRRRTVVSLPCQNPFNSASTMVFVPANDAPPLKLTPMMVLLGVASKADDTTAI